jgi:uncharacterized membrane protein required for colicin V production
MTIGTTDIFLLVIIVSTLVVGFFWGAVRSILLLGAWLAAFLAGAYLKLQLGVWLARQWTEFPPQFNEMAAFGIVYLTILLAAPVLVFLGVRGEQRVSRYQALDDLAGAGIALLVAILGIGGLIVVLSTYYGDPGSPAPGGPDWVATLYNSLLGSTIGGAIADHVVPIMGAVLGPLLPPDVREVMV